MLYGCNVANGQSGVEFIQTLADLTEADIAASDDLTGSSDFGGDWVLESMNGVVESKFIFSEEQLTYFNGVLSPVSTDISGTLLADNTFDRPKTYADDSGYYYSDTYYAAEVGDITGLYGAQFQYFTRNVTPSASGTFTFTVTAADFSDTFLLLYNGSFDPTNPLVNLILAQDDTAGNLFSQFSYDLTAGQTYVLILTSFDTSATGTLTVNVSGPGAVTVAANEFSSDAPTVDETAPTLDGANSTPADNATSVAVGSNIVIDFSENIAFGSSGTITIYNVTTSQTVETFTVSSGSATGSIYLVFR